MTQRFKNKRISAPTIDDIKPEDTSALVGYWKLTDAEIAIGGNVPDYSGNGYDLKIMPGGSPDGFGGTDFSDYPIPWEDTGYGNPNGNEAAWFTNDGYLTFANAWGCAIPVAGTLLDTQDKFVVFGAELDFVSYSDIGDFDAGTFWAGDSATNNNPFDSTGFNLAQSGSSHWVRVGWTDAVNGESQTIGQGQNFDAGSKNFMALAYRPGVNLTGIVTLNAAKKAINEQVGADNQLYEFSADSSTDPIGGTFPATLEAQNGYFGIRCQTGYSGMSGFRNMFLWVFDAEPPHLDETLKWLAHNPSRIPPWWIGL